MGIVHQRLFATLTGFYPSTCTIQEATEARDLAGQPIATWVDKAGHIDLACRLSPAGGGERKTVTQIYSQATHVVELTGYYPLITAKMRAVVAGQVYDILLPERDGQSASTKLVCQVIR